MPAFTSPQNDLDRAGFVRTALQTGRQDINAGNVYLAESTMKALDTDGVVFSEAVDDLGADLANRIKQVREQNVAITKLIKYTRDLWAVLRRRVDRCDEPVEVLRFYELPIDGNTPNPRSNEAWLKLGEQVVSGDAKAVAAGHPAMVNPSAAELEQVLTVAKKEFADVTPADRAYDEEQQEVAQLRPRIDEIIRDVMADLRYHLRKLEPASQRRIMRTYGATFRLLPGEAPDPGDSD